MTTVEAHACRPIILDPVGAGPTLGCRSAPARRTTAPARLPGLSHDTRSCAGRRHPLTAMLGLAAAAVLAGARSITAIAAWAADAPQPVRAALGTRRHPLTGRWEVLTETTAAASRRLGRSGRRRTTPGRPPGSFAASTGATGGRRAGRCTTHRPSAASRPTGRQRRGWRTPAPRAGGPPRSRPRDCATCWLPQPSSIAANTCPSARSSANPAARCSPAMPGAVLWSSTDSVTSTSSHRMRESRIRCDEGQTRRSKKAGTTATRDRMASLTSRPPDPKRREHQVAGDNADDSPLLVRSPSRIRIQ